MGDPGEIRRILAAGALALLMLLLPSTAIASPPVANWVETGQVKFSGTQGFFRSQGIASDGNSIFFSWNLGLSRTEIDDTSIILADNTTAAIPPDLAASNHNHIGDIDVADGIIYAPIEDGPAYAEPWVVLYDAETLQPTGQRYLLDEATQRGGVPWIAVDEPRGVAYTMEWNDTGRLFVHRLSDFALIDIVELGSPVTRIQGAKVFRGNLYASRDNGRWKSVLAINPENGHVTYLFDRNLGDDYEAEGIAFVRRPSGTMMLTTGIHEGSQGYTDMHIYRIDGDVTPPALSDISFRKTEIKPGARLTLQLTASEPATASMRWSKCIGPKRKPCAKTRVAGIARTVDLVTGPNQIRTGPNYPRLENTPVRLNPGRWQLTVTPTDPADIVGEAQPVRVTVLSPRRPSPPRSG